MKDFKEKKRETNHEKQESYELSAEVESMLKEKGLDIETMTLDDLYPEELDKEGKDLSLMSGFELDIWITYCKTRHHLAKNYPLKKTKAFGQLRASSHEAPQIDIENARHNLKSKIYVEALKKVVKIFDNIETLQKQASPYEKACLRHYGFITYNWLHAPNPEKFRAEFIDTDFKICQKYNVPTLEEPYYFLSEKRRLDIKLEGNMLKRTGGYSENEIRISILDAFK